MEALFTDMLELSVMGEIIKSTERRSQHGGKLHMHGALDKLAHAVAWVLD